MHLVTFPHLQVLITAASVRPAAVGSLCTSSYTNDCISSIGYMSMGSRKYELSVSFVSHRTADKKGIIYTGTMSNEYWL